MRAKSEHFNWAALTAMRAGDETGARRLLEVRSGLDRISLLCETVHTVKTECSFAIKAQTISSAQAKAKLVECASASRRRASVNLALAVKLEEALHCEDR